MKTKEELNTKVLTDEELTGAHGGMKIIVTDLLEKYKDKISEMLQTRKEHRKRDK